MEPQRPLRFALLQCFILLVLAWSSLATPVPEDAAIQQLSQLLGFPTDMPMPEVQAEKAPEFVTSMYECLKEERIDCVPGYHGSGADKVRTSLGIENLAAPDVHMFNGKGKVTDSLAISFNLSETQGLDETILYALLRVHRAPVADDRLNLLTQQCGALSQWKLRLFFQEGTHPDGSPVFRLRAAKPIQGTDFDQEDWVEFYNLTDIYARKVDSLRDQLRDHETSVFEARLQLKTPLCSSLSPTELGFSSTGIHKAQLVSVEETHTPDDDLSFSHVMSAIAKQQYLKRSRRQTEEQEISGTGLHLATEEPPSTVSSTTVPTPRAPIPDSLLPDSISGYNLRRCDLYHYTISFREDLGIKSFIYPTSYQANFCAGHCDFPLGDPKDFNKHAYIQSYASFRNKDRIPPPCCVPKPESLQHLVVVVENEAGQFEQTTYREMIASDCTCL